MEKMTCSNISCRHGDFSLHVRELSISRGEKVALLGENGCGKTTLLQILAGLLPAKGELLCDGGRWDVLTARQRSGHMAYLPQQADVLFNLTVAELMDLSLDGSCLLHGDERQRVLQATQMEELQQRIVHSLSGGEKQRAMLARVFCRDCPFIFLDEPTAPLDLRHAVQLMRYLKSTSRTVVAAMHDINLAIRYFDRFLLMKNGTILYDRSKHDLVVAEFEEIYGIRLNDCNGFLVPDA